MHHRRYQRGGAKHQPRAAVLKQKMERALAKKRAAASRSASTKEAKEKHSQRYTVIKKVGEGGYATVYKARDNKAGNTVVALKCAKYNKEKSIDQSTVREVGIMRSLSHPNIIRVLDTYFTPKHVVAVCEWMDTNLYDVIRAARETDGEIGLPLDTVRDYTRQLVDALQYCHTRGILHRDMKPDNVLLDRSRTVCKLGDFGQARKFVPCSHTLFTPEVTTRGYRPPELLLGHMRYGPALDMWGLGCIVAEMLLGRCIFDTPDSDDEEGTDEEAGTDTDGDGSGDTEEEDETDDDEEEDDGSSRPTDYTNSTHGTIAQFEAVEDVLGSLRACDIPTGLSMPAWMDLRHQKKGSSFAILFPMLDEDGLDFMRAVFQYNPERRLKAVDALSHPWLSV